jgi:hypothetical protein
MKLYDYYLFYNVIQISVKLLNIVILRIIKKLFNVSLYRMVIAKYVVFTNLKLGPV